MRFAHTLMLLSLFALSATTARAQSATQDVTIQVAPISVFEIPDSEVMLTITGVDASGDPAPATDASTSYNLTTNATGMKITGMLDTDYSSGLTLQVLFGIPAAGGSATQRTLSTTPQDIVNGLSHVNSVGVPITYTAEATIDVAPSTSEERTVTYTITSDA